MNHIIQYHFLIVSNVKKVNTYTSNLLWIEIYRQLLTVDLLARASMKNAANCDT